MRGNRVGTVSVSLVLIVSLIAASGALAEGVQDPTGTACIGVEEAAECERVALASDGDASCESRWGYCLAASDEGDASCQEGTCLAASQSGDAEGFLAVTGDGDATGALAVSAMGDTRGVFAAAGTGDADGSLLSSSGTGNASSSYGAAVSGTGNATSHRLGLAAISGTGNTSADIIEINGMNDADGCIAVSGTGSADAECSGQGRDLEASGCDTGQEAGTEEVCRDPDEREEVADVLVCDTDLATDDDEGHAWCAIRLGACVQVIWGVGVDPIFVGGHDGCQAGVFYDQDGHDHAPLP